MKEATAKSMAKSIARRTDIPLGKVPEIMMVLKSYGVYKVDKMQHYTCTGQMNLVSDFPQYCPDNPEADVDGWAFEEKDDMEMEA